MVLLEALACYVIITIHISIIIIVDLVIIVVAMFLPLSLRLSLSTQPVRAAGRSPRAWFCSRFLPVKGEFFLVAVTKCCSRGYIGSLQTKEYSLDLHYVKSALR